MAKILMVDDDQDFLEAAEAILSRKGHTVITANDPEEGEKKIKQENPDIILLDIMMVNPDDGIALAHKLRKQKINIPIVMLSGVGKVTGYSYGKCDSVLPCDDFIEKPVSPEIFLDKIDKILSR
jgi:DNA-binding response OmpR family regulator